MVGKFLRWLDKEWPVPYCRGVGLIPVRVRNLFPVILFASVVTAAAPSDAVVIVSDDFDGNTVGLSSSPLGWTIENIGDVDILGECQGGSPFYDLLPGNGCYIDLDGSGTPGLLTKSVSLQGGIPALLEFGLAGSQRGDDVNTVSVLFGSASRSIATQWEDPFSLFDLAFTPPTTGDYFISFLNDGGDAVGALLDNVRVSQGVSVPQSPSSVPAPLPLLGAGAAWAHARRLRMRVDRPRWRC